MRLFRTGLICAMVLCAFAGCGVAYAQSRSDANNDGQESNLPDFSQVDVGDYFDARDLAPPLANEPNDDYELRALDPDKDKASRFVVIDKDYDENSVEARLVSAKRAMDLGRYEAALRFYRGLRQDYPKNKDVLLGYATALQEKGKEDEAIVAYQNLLDVDPTNLDAHINMLGLVAQRYPAVALQRLNILNEEQKSFNPSIVGQIAFVQARLGHYEDALSSYAVLSAKQPDNPLHILNMGIVADKAGWKDKAIKYYEQAIEVDSIYGAGNGFDRDQIFDRLAQLR